MAEQDSTASDPTPTPLNPPAEPNAAPDPAPPPPPAPRKKRRWPKIVAAVVLVLLLLVVLLPTIASTGVVRSMILKSINDDLAGKVEIADWSIGWNSGIRVDGLKLLDPQGNVVAQASRVKTELSLIRVLKSGFKEFALGRTDVDNLDLTDVQVDELGDANLLRAVRPKRPKPAKPQAEPLRLSGDVHVNNLTGNVTAPAPAPGGARQRVRILPSNVAVALTGLNDPIKNDVQVAYAVDDPANPGAGPTGTGTIALAGDADLFDHDKFVGLARVRLKQNLKLATVNLAGANAFLSMAGVKLTLAGIASGDLDLSVQGIDNVGGSGQVGVKGLVASGELLKGGRFASDLSIPVKVASVTDNAGGKVNQSDVRIITDYGDVVVSVDAPQSALAHLAAGEPPGRQGRITLTADFGKNIPRLAEGLRGLLQLQPDVKPESAHLFAKAEAWIYPDRVVPKLQASLTDVAATNKSGRVTLAPVSATLDLTYAPQPGKPFDVAQLGDAAVTLDSVFAQLKGTGGAAKGTDAAAGAWDFSLAGGGDFAKLVEQLRQFADVGGLGLSGAWNVRLAGRYDGRTLTIAEQQPATVKLDRVSVMQLKNQSLDATFAGVIGSSDQELALDVRSLSVVAQPLLELRKNPGDLRVRLTKSTGAFTGAGGVTVFADLKKLGDLLSSTPPAATATTAEQAKPIGELTKGLLNGSLTFTRADQPVTRIAGNFTVDVAVTTAKEPITDKVAITLTADAPDDLTRETLASLTVKSDVMNAAITDARLALYQKVADQARTVASGPLDLIRAAKVNVTVERLDALQSMLASFSPPPAVAEKAAEAVAAVAPPAPAAPPAGKKKNRAPVAPAPQVDEAQLAAAAKPLPALRVLSGKLTLSGDIARDGQAVLLKDALLNVSRFAFERGDGRYDAKDQPITAKLTVAAVPAPQQPAAPGDEPPSILDQLARVEFRDLSADLDAGHLTMPKPIVATNLSAASPTVDGAVEMKGALPPLLRLLEALQGQKPGTGYPYAGDYALAQNVSTANEQIRLAGNVTLTKVKSYDPADPTKIAFSEDQIALTNDVAADLKADALTVNAFALSTQSGALGLKVAPGAQLTDWSRRRNVKAPVKLDLHADWAKLWAMVRPMLDPETLESLKDFEIAGVCDRTFTVAGAFPAVGVDRRGREVALPTAQSLKFLTLTGGIDLDRVRAAGVTVMPWPGQKSVSIPVVLEHGVATIRDPDEPADNVKPKAFACNDEKGKIDLGGVQVNLLHVSPADGSIVPWFTIPKGKVLMDDVALNPALAGSTIGSWINPNFSGAQDARGRLTVTVNLCRDLPLDWFTANKPPVPGKALTARRARQLASVSDGEADLKLEISQMQLQAPFFSFFKMEGISGEVREGHVQAKAGVITSDIPVVDPSAAKAGGAAGAGAAAAKPPTPLMRWSGKVNLQDRQLIDFNTAMSRDLLTTIPIPFIRNNAKYLPPIVTVPVTGSFDAPHVDFMAALTKSYLPGFTGGKPEDMLRDVGSVIGGLRGDKKKDNADNDGGKKNDPLGGILDAAGGLLNKDKDKDKDKGTAPPDGDKPPKRRAPKNSDDPKR